LLFSFQCRDKYSVFAAIQIIILRVKKKKRAFIKAMVYSQIRFMLVLRRILRQFFAKFGFEDMKTTWVVLWSLLVVLLASCAHLVPPVSATFTPDENTAVLYARLNLEDRISMGNRIALWLENVDLKKPVYIYFDKNRPVYAITIEPGHYRLIGFAGIDMTHRILGRRVFHEKNSKKTFVVPFEARTNSAVYIGDFIGYAKVNLVEEEWALKTVTNNFAGTSIEFHKEYPNLTNLPVFSIFEPQP